MKMSQSFGVLTGVLLLAGCGSSMADGWQDAAIVCGTTAALDQIIMESNGTPPTPAQQQRLRDMLDNMSTASQRAASADDRYRQLELLVGNFIRATESGDPEGLFDLIAIEGECEAIANG